MSCDLAKTRLKDELAFLNREDVQSVLNSEDAYEDSLSELDHKIQHIRGVLACYKDLRNVLCLKELAIRQEYEDLSPGPTRDELDQILREMAQLLDTTEVRLYHILGVEDGWFSRQTYVWKLWDKQNPRKAASIVVGSAAFVGGVVSFFNYEGIKVFFLLHVVSAPLSVPAAVLAGGLIGGCLAVFGLCCVWKQVYTFEEEKVQSHLQQVRKMVEEIQKVPNEVFLDKLSAVSKKCDIALGNLPTCEDRRCTICLEEGREVKAPVKAPRCQGDHWGPEGPHARDCAQKVELVGYRRVNEPQAISASQIVVRVISAELYRSFDKFGRMDPFALVDCCKMMAYSGNGSGDKLRFQVMEENFLGFGKSTFCGDATVPVDMLLSGARTVSVGFMQTQPQPIPLYKRGENTGRIVVQILIHLPENDEQVADLTYVDTEKFVTPVQRLGVSGGTAPFFSLQLTKPEGKRFGDYWIGKDLSRATDEVQFYEKVKSLSKHSSREVQALYNFMFESTHQDRLDFWRLYVGGIQRLAWEAARAYRHRFGNSDSWAKVQLVVYDFDSMTDSDFMGQVFVDLAETPETTAPLLTADGAPVVGKEGEATITYSISWRRFHAASRLQGAWSVRIIRAEKLPVCDTSVWPLSGSSDPFVKVFAFSTEESYRCVQRSTVKVKNLDPVWEETFDLPIGKPEHANLEAIVGSPKAEDFPIESRIGLTLPAVIYTLEVPKAEAEGLKYWTELMHTICGRQFRSFLV
eukprot:g17638.t1